MRKQDKAVVGEVLQAAVQDYSEWQPGEPWRSPLFTVARALKRHPAMRDMDGVDALRIVSAIVSWQEFADLDSRLVSEDDVETAFISAWSAVRFASGEDLLTLAIAESAWAQVPLKVDRGRGYERFIRVAFALGGLLAEPGQDQIIAIPQERWARALGVERHTIACWCRWAQADGFLKLAVEYSKPHCRARRFRLIRPTTRPLDQEGH